MVRKKRKPARSVQKDHSELFMVIVVCVVALVGIIVMLGKSGYLEMLSEEGLAGKAFECAPQHAGLTSSYLDYQQALNKYNEYKGYFERQCSAKEIGGTAYQLTDRRCPDYELKMEYFMEKLTEAQKLNYDYLDYINKNCPDSLASIKEFDVSEIPMHGTEYKE